MIINTEQYNVDIGIDANNREPYSEYFDDGIDFTLSLINPVRPIPAMLIFSESASSSDMLDIMNMIGFYRSNKMQNISCYANEYYNCFRTINTVIEWHQCKYECGKIHKYNDLPRRLTLLERKHCGTLVRCHRLLENTGYDILDSARIRLSYLDEISGYDNIDDALYLFPWVSERLGCFAEEIEANDKFDRKSINERLDQENVYLSKLVRNIMERLDLSKVSTTSEPN